MMVSLSWGIQFQCSGRQLDQVQTTVQQSLDAHLMDEQENVGFEQPVTLHALGLVAQTTTSQVC